MSSNAPLQSRYRSLGSGTFDAKGSIASFDWPERCVESNALLWNSEGNPLQLGAVARESSEAKGMSGLSQGGSMPPLTPVSMSSTSSIGSSLCSSGCDPVTSETDEFSSSSNSCCDSTLDDGVSREKDTPVLRTEPDIYWQQHPIETPTLISTKLQEFDLQIQQQVSMYASSSATLSPSTPKFIVAERVCPHIVTSSFKLMFLRCECFDVDLAIKRYIKYWNKRVEFFGEERAYKPITAESFYENNEQQTLELGACQLIHRPKPTRISDDGTAIRDDGRSIIWIEAMKLDPTKYSRQAGYRAVWYFFHALLEDELVQQRGFICLCSCAHFSNKNRDPVATRTLLPSLQGCMPIRFSVLHICHPTPILRIASRIFLIFAPERLRKRCLMHSGTVEHVVFTLESKYHISRAHIPTEMGGNLELDVMKWIQERRAAGL